MSQLLAIIARPRLEDKFTKSSEDRRAFCAEALSASKMDSDSAVDLSTSAQDMADRRKSARSIRKPELFAEERHEGSLLSNGSTKRKRTTNGTIDDEPDEDEDDESSPEESEGEADEEELREKWHTARSKATRKPAPKKARKSNKMDATLAIRSANVQSKAPSKAAKVQQARARKSQANEEGLYGRLMSFVPSMTKADTS